MHAWKLLCLCFTCALVDDADEAVITSDCHSYCSDLEESGSRNILFYVEIKIWMF